MNDKIMNKATFKEICKIMNGRKTDVWECIKGVFEVSLLFFPGLMCKEVALLANISDGATLLEAKGVIEKSIKNIFNTFSGRKYKDFSTKYEHAQTAHILIVFAAYFDSIKMYLPNEEKEIKLTSREKYLLTNDGIEKYLKYLEEKAATKPETKAREIFEYDLSMPNPIEGLDSFSNGLRHFYLLLNQEFIDFFKKLSFWENLRDNKKDAFLAQIRELPDKAVGNYQRQYYELSVCFNDFFIWSNIQEHRKISQSIDVGFSDISEKIETYFEKIKETKVTEILNKYEKKYKAYIKEPVIDTSEMDYDTSGDVIFPAKEAIFIPQRFKTLLYEKNLQLEERAWKSIKEREDIGKFISDTLRHSKVGELPLLILGLPGAGKSLLCNMLAAKILCHEYHVIIIKLRDTIADETISQQINQQMKRDFTNACTWDDIAESGIEKPVLLIFDGYDELLQASGKTYSDYIKKIAQFQRDQRNIYNIFVKCIITSRTTLIDKALIMDNAAIIRLSDFDDERIGIWSDIWNETNKVFFATNKLELFEVEKDSKVYELAKQPLLLLMLALYDSNSNALKKQKNLNSTQLYYSLIREFVSREKRKSASFRSKEECEQQKIIDEEVRKISIAALGMYNRKVLYIRSAELQSDIEFIESGESYEERLKDAELKESDKRLGSFLFIHKSKSTGPEQKDQIKDVAYEFLHNTFGEFLTSYFIVSELYKILDWIDILLARDMKGQWNLSEQRAFCLCLSYAPLFSRPVVIKMIHEWSDSYLENKGLSTEHVNKAMDFLIDIELKRVINGDDLFVLKDVVEKKGNPFNEVEIMKHLAIYSLNIVILRTVICTDQHTFKFEGKNNWNKLVCLWKFAFSSDELSDYANIFEANPTDNKCVVKYRSFNKGLMNQQKGCNKLFHSYYSIGDELTYSVMGALIGSAQMDKIFDGIQHNQLNVRTRYIWNYLLSVLKREDISQNDLFNIIREYDRLCWEERDLEYIFTYYLLNNFLLKKKIIRYNDREIRWFFLEEVVLKVNDLNYSNGHFRIQDNLCHYIIEMALNILDYIPLKDDEVEILLMKTMKRNSYHKILPSIDSDFMVGFLNIIINKIMYKRKKENVEYLIRNNVVEEFLGIVLTYQKDIMHVQRKIGEIIEISYNLILLNNDKYAIPLFEVYVNVLDHYRLFDEMKISKKQKIMLIEYLYIICQNNLKLLLQYDKVIRQLLYGFTIRRGFQISEELAFKLCFLARKIKIISISRMHDDLIWINNKKSNQISEDFRKEIKKIADMFQWKDLI